MPDVSLREADAGLMAAESVHLIVERVETFLRILTLVRVTGFAFFPSTWVIST